MKTRALMLVTSFFVATVPGLVSRAATSPGAVEVSSGETATTSLSGMDGTAVTIVYEEYPSTTMPNDPAPTVLLLGGADPENLFSGDLRAYSGLRFKIAGDGLQPYQLKLVIRREGSDFINFWSYSDFVVPQTAGEWSVVRIPLSFDQGWNQDNNLKSPGTVQEKWSADLADVSSMYVQIRRNGYAAQTYSLAGFQLVGSGDGAITEPAQLTLIEDYFGVSDMDAINRTLDSDGDGMSDYDELIAGLDPASANSVFQALMEKTAAGNVIRWPGVLGGRYTVMRAGNLMSGFSVLQGGITAGFTGTQEITDTEPLDGPNFYKVVKQ